VLHANGCLVVIFQFLQSTLQLLQRYDNSISTSITVTNNNASATTAIYIDNVYDNIDTKNSDNSKSVIRQVVSSSSDIQQYCLTAMQTAAWTISNLARGDISGNLFINSGELLLLR